MPDLVVTVDSVTKQLPESVRTKLAEDLPSGGGVSSWDDLEDKPPVIAEGATEAEARAAIGAGVSNLTLGATSFTAKPGDYTPPIGDLPAGTTLTVATPATARPTIRTDIRVIWVGHSTEPANGLPGDLWVKPAGA